MGKQKIGKIGFLVLLINYAKIAVKLFCLSYCWYLRYGTNLYNSIQYSLLMKEKQLKGVTMLKSALPILLFLLAQYSIAGTTADAADAIYGSTVTSGGQSYFIFKLDNKLLYIVVDGTSLADYNFSLVVNNLATSGANNNIRVTYDDATTQTLNGETHYKVVSVQLKHSSY